MTQLVRYLAVWTLYGLGHWLSLLTDALSHDWPRCPERMLDSVYYLSCWCLMRSSDLDDSEMVWLTRRKGETDVEFDARCRDRFGDDYITD